MTLVHVNGVFEHYVKFCKCSDASSEHKQLFIHKLFPSTFDQPQTAFTSDVLEYFRIDSMECKTLAQSFFQKLRRVTNNAFPDEVLVCLPFSYNSPNNQLMSNVKDQYQELMRVSQQMRKLKNSKHFGEVYSESLPPRSLTIFCPSCSQPGINLPSDWMNLPNWLTH